MKKLKYLLLFIPLFFPSFVSAATTDIGYITNNTTVILSNNKGVDYTLPVNTVNSTVPNIRTIIIQYGNQNLLKDTIYELELRTPSASFGDNINHFYIRANGDIICRFYGMGDLTNGYPKIYFSCPSNFSYMTIGLGTISGNDDITSSSSFRWNYAFLRKLDSKEDMDFGPVISNQTQNTQDIINNENNNTQNIINNQNALLGTKCQNEWNSSLTTATTHRGITFTPILKNGVVEKYVISGTRTSGSNAYATMMTNFTLHQGTHIKVYTNGNIYLQLYDGTNVINTKDYTATETKIWSQVSIFTTQSPIDNVDFKVMITPDSDTTFCLYGSYVSKIDSTNNAINNLDDTLKSDDIDDNNLASAFEDFNDFLDDNSTITQLLTLPITLYTAILNNVNGSCSPFNLGSLFGTDLILPCINISQYLGNSLWTMIDIIISGFAIYSIAKKMIKIFNNFSSLKEGDVIND